MTKKSPQGTKRKTLSRCTLLLYEYYDNMIMRNRLTAFLMRIITEVRETRAACTLTKGGGDAVVMSDHAATVRYQRVPPEHRHSSACRNTRHTNGNNSFSHRSDFCTHPANKSQMVIWHV